MLTRTVRWAMTLVLYVTRDARPPYAVRAWLLFGPNRRSCEGSDCCISCAIVVPCVVPTPRPCVCMRVVVGLSCICFALSVGVTLIGITLAGVTLADHFGACASVSI